MNEPRNEMTNEAARLVLHSYRPNGIDARDPRFRAALDQAAHDPDLARWFNEQQTFDTFIANKLAEIRPPADLLVLIVAGLETAKAEELLAEPITIEQSEVLAMKTPEVYGMQP
jgi:hypothetical protein